MRQKTYLFRRISALTLLLCMFLSACAVEEEVPVLLENNELSIPSITVEYGDVFNVDYATGGIHPYSEKLKFASAGTCRHSNKRIISSTAGNCIKFIFPTLESLFKLADYIKETFFFRNLRLNSEP